MVVHDFDALARRLADGPSRRSILRGLLGGSLLAAGVRGSSALAAPPDTVAICHYSAETDSYSLISVSQNAVDAHLAHGDVLPNDCGEGPTCAACFEPPTVCTTGSAGVIHDFGVVFPDWVVCRADADSAWLSTSISDDGYYDPLVACQSLGYTSVGGFGVQCGNVCGSCEDASTSCSDPGTEEFNGGGKAEMEEESNILYGDVTWLCLA